MSDATDWTVLVPVAVLEGETVPEPLVDLLANCPVVILGYHVLPEQTAPGQARMQFEDRAQAKLDELAAAFGEAGGPVDTRLVFTHDEEQTVDRVAEETNSSVVLASNPTGQVERVLVPLGGAVDVERIGAFLAALLAGTDVAVTLFHVAPDEASVADGEAILDGAAEALVAGGVAEGRIDREVAVDDRPLVAISDAATDHDVVVMSESAPSLRSFLFGDAFERIADRSLGPVLVVQEGRADAGETPTDDGDDEVRRGDVPGDGDESGGDG